MSLNLSAIAVRERAVTLFFILLLTAAGAYAFIMLGRAEDPNFTIKTLTVTTVWPGATAREMQDLVAEPLEKRLQELTWYDPTAVLDAHRSSWPNRVVFLIAILNCLLLNSLKLLKPAP